jgi:hypothetical protein
MLSKQRFHVILLLISIFLSLVFIYNYEECGIIGCSNAIIIWISIGLIATVIVSKFASPRRGRYALSYVIGLGCTGIQLISFVQRYYSCNWKCLFYDNKVSATTAAFNNIYRFFALMLLSLASAYTLAFKQHLAWNTIFFLISHYNMFAFFMLLFGFSTFVTGNLLSALAPLVLVSATELLNRTGRNKALALILRDCTSRQAHWQGLIRNSPEFKQHIKRLQLTLRGGSLAAVCEPVDPKTKKLVPITVLQTHSDIDRLYRDCSVLNYFFQDWIRTWFPSGICSDDFEFCNPKAAYRDAFKIRVANCFPDIVRGPIKAPNRVISKVVSPQSSPACASSRVTACHLVICVLLYEFKVTSHVRCTALTAGGWIV